MARSSKRSPIPNHATSVVESVNNLVDAVTGLLGSIGHAAAGAAVRLKDAGAQTVARAPAVVAQKSAKLRKAVAASWARYTPAERGCPTRFEMVLRMPAHLSEEQVARLQVIAAKCPVHRTLEGEVAFDERVELT